MTFIRFHAKAMAVALAAAFCALPALAADNKPGVEGQNPKFMKLDKNKDGFLTKDEVSGIRDYGKAFAQADENRDGKLDQAEFIKAEAIYDRILAGKYVDDSVITAKVKAALLKEPQLKSLDVSVETSGGQVLLSGFVNDDNQRRKAIQVADRVSGVAGVKDGMAIR